MATPFSAYTPEPVEGIHHPEIKVHVCKSHILDETAILAARTNQTCGYCSDHLPAGTDMEWLVEAVEMDGSLFILNIL